MITIGKKRTKVIFIAFIFMVIFVFLGNNAFAEITQNGNDWYTGNGAAVGADITGAIQLVMGAGAGALAAPITTLVNVILTAVFLVLWLLLSPISGGAFPFPDQIIFNKVPFFDPNIFNPPTGVSGDITGAPAYIIKDIVSSLYGTGFAIASAIFGIAALVIGIKLALSTVASEKAHYKTALNNWIIGIVLLFTTHFIILGMFTINEAIVQIISDSSRQIEFKVATTDFIPNYTPGVKAIAKGISSVITSFMPNSGIAEWTTVEFYGYGGLVLMFFLKATLGVDLVSAIIFGIILGQTIALIVMYLRRFFYCILLIMIAPLIVAMDVLKKTI